MTRNKFLAMAICITVLISMMSVVSFAEATLTIDNIQRSAAVDGLVTITVDYTASTEVEQVTILAVAGGETAPTPVDTNIKYIDQEAKDGQFSFVVAEADFSLQIPNLFIKLGGTALNSAVPGQNPVPIIEVTGVFTVFGTVSSAADAQDFGDNAINTELNGAWKTTVSLKTTFLSQPIVTIDVDAGTKAYSFANVENGTYVLEIKRAGYLSRYVPVTVNNGNVNVGDKTLLAGDLNEDFVIDASDTGILFAILGKAYGDLEYNPIRDIYGDGIIDASDTGSVFPNLGKDVFIYEENVDFGN